MVKNDLLRVLLNTIILLIILVVLDIFVEWAGEKCVRWLNKAPREGDAALVNYNLNAAIPDVAILGSSTAICHYDPEIIHDSLLKWLGQDYQVFNMGISNQRLTWDYYGMKCLLARTLPKIVIVDVWPTYIGEGDISNSFHAFRPYVHINPNVKDMMEKHGQLDYLMISNMYCFNTELVKLLMSSLKPKGANGFTKSTTELSQIIKKQDRDTSALSQLSMEEFDAMITLAKENEFKFFVVMSPTLRSADTTSLSYQYIKNTCFKNNIPFLDYSNDEKYYQSHYFRDVTHLNYYGAEFFSKELMQDIKRFIICNDEF